MEQNNEHVIQMMEQFYKIAVQYFGKEIALPSNQFFEINQIRDEQKEKNEEYQYSIQYGFPQSGSVILHFSYFKNKNEVALTKFSIDALPADKNMVVANFASQTNVMPEANVSMNFGINSGTKQHTSVKDIASNPNALEMINIAITDLQKAQVLDDCYISVPEESKLIPCCNSRNMPRDFGTRS